MHFRDGSTVPQDVVAYWLALAIQLKDPAAHGQFGIYLDQLDPADARTLSNWVLESWISYDTQTPSLEEATTYAKTAYASRGVYHASSWTRGSQLPPEEQAKLIAAITREKANELLNSGSDTKGILALAARADPV